MRQFRAALVFAFIGVLSCSAYARDAGDLTLAERQKLQFDISIQDDIVFWQSIMDSDDYRDFRDYLGLFPNGRFVLLAQRRLSRIKATARAQDLIFRYSLRKKQGRNAISYAIPSDDIDLLEWLKTNGVYSNTQDRIGITHMHRAAEFNAVNVMEWLQAHGVSILDPDASGISSKSPMHSAIRSNSIDAMIWLNNQGVAIDTPDHNGNTLMHWAAETGAIDAIKWLETRGVDFDTRNFNGETPMFFTGKRNTVEILEWFNSMHCKAIGHINALCVDVNMRNNKGETMMHRLGISTDALEWLDARGADFNMQDDDGNEPIHHAALTFGRIDLIEWFRDHGVDLDVQNRNGRTPMHMAASRNYGLQVLKWLKTNGADINVEDGSGYTPMEIALQREDRDRDIIAVQRGDSDMIAWFKRNGGRHAGTIVEN